MGSSIRLWCFSHSSWKPCHEPPSLGLSICTNRYRLGRRGLVALLCMPGLKDTAYNTTANLPVWCRLLDWLNLICTTASLILREPRITQLGYCRCPKSCVRVASNFGECLQSPVRLSMPSSSDQWHPHTVCISLQCSAVQCSTAQACSWQLVAETASTSCKSSHYAYGSTPKLSLCYPTELKL